MAEITARLVKELRERTGLGMMEVGSWYSRRETAKLNSSAAKSLMINADKRPDTDTVTDANIAPSSMPSGSVMISPEKRQKIGVKTEEVEKRTITHTMRLLGRVAPDKTEPIELRRQVSCGYERSTRQQRAAL